MLLIVDRALTPRNGSVVVALVNNEFTVKRYESLNGRIRLLPANKNYNEIIISEGIEFEVWGVVTNVIHQLS